MKRNVLLVVVSILLTADFSFGSVMVAQTARHIYDPITSTSPFVYEINPETDDPNVWIYGHTWPAGNTTPKRHGALIMAFRLPELPKGYFIKNAVFKWFYIEAAGTWVLNHDIYGLGYRSDQANPLIDVNDYFLGTGDTTDATLIQGAITAPEMIGVVNEWRSTEPASKALANYIQAQYDSGAEQNDWILLRINKRSNSSAKAIRHFIKSNADPSFAPYIEYEISDVVSSLTYYVSPNASGNASGSDPENATFYADSTFWDKIKNSIETENIQIIFAESNLYGSDSVSYPALFLSNMGNPANRLTLSGISQSGTKWLHSSLQDSLKYFIRLEGCQNIKIEKMTFEGNVYDWGVSLTPNSKRPTRNIAIDQCTFKNLTSAYYGALGVSDATRDVWISNCTFDTVGIGPTSHMVYGSESRNINIDSCSFKDCTNTFLKIRKDSDYWTISNSTFVSTSSSFSHPFIEICALNSTYNTYDPADPMEYFGYHIKVNDSSFLASNSSVDAVSFRGLGYDAYEYENNGIRLDAIEGSILENGTTAEKTEVLWDNLGIKADKVVMYNNTFTNIRNKQSYVYELAWNSTSAGWVGDADIYDTSTHTVGTELEPAGCIVNGDFEMKGYPSRYWRYNKNNILIPAPHAGLNGTSKAIFLDGEIDSHRIHQWLYNTSQVWQVDFCFALGSFTGTGEKFMVDIVHNEIGDKKVSIAVNSDGQIGIYNGSTFHVLSNLGTITFSVDGNGDGDYSDAADTLNWYHLQITGNYSSTPYVDVQITDLNTYLLNATKKFSNVSYWVGQAPSRGLSFPSSIVFTSTYCDVILDEVAVESISPWGCDADKNNNNILDFAMLSEEWLKKGGRLSCDLFRDGMVDFKDLVVLASYWLE